MNNIFYFYGNPSDKTNVLVLIGDTDDIPKTLSYFLFYIEERYKIEADINLGIVDNGVLTWVYKGILSKVNNNVLHTYYLYSQPYRNLITKEITRQLKEEIEVDIDNLLELLSLPVTTKDISIKLSILDNTNIDKCCSTWSLEMSVPDLYRAISLKIMNLLGLLAGKEYFTDSQILKDVPPLKNILNKEIDGMSGEILDYYKGVLISLLKQHLWADS